MNMHMRGGEVLEQFAQRCCRCLILGSVQGQVWQSSEQSGIVESFPHGGGFGAKCSLRSLPVQSILQFYGVQYGHCGTHSTSWQVLAEQQLQ